MKKISPFQSLVYQAVKNIPRGKVATYSDIARAIGRPESARAVGNALHVNPFAPAVPCHRVVKSDGSIGGFAGGALRKLALLKKEGIVCVRGRISDWPASRFSIIFLLK